tara:strand:+ start:1008 stop:2657 length:1650 start_codon:yes stop_codon:yes gene_type:complete
MSGFRLRAFGGKAPQVTPRLLPDDMAQVATSTRLDSGRLEPWKANASVTLSGLQDSYSVSANTKTLFRYSSTIWFGSDNDVNMVRSPLAEDPWDRIYETGGTTYPRMRALAGGTFSYKRLGLPKPTPAPSTSISGTASTTETPTARSYIYSFVSQYGEEGEPSDASSVITVTSNQTVDVTLPTSLSGEYQVTQKRVYRTDTDGTFRFLADVPLATATYNDSVTEANLGEAIPSATWEAAPDEDTADHKDGALQGLIALPNGFLAGFVGQTVCFSEAFQPHAWPDAYKFSVRSEIVAIAPLPSGVLVLTKEKPVVIQGQDPASMSLSEIDSNLSCESKRSVVDMGPYVIYASPDGLVQASDNGLQLMTAGLLSRDQWQDLVPSTMVAFPWEGQYVCFYADGTESKGFIFDPRGGRNSYVKLDFHATAGFNDLENDELYLVVGGSVVKFAEGTTNNTFKWRSKKFYTSRPINPGVAKVDCDSYPSAQADQPVFRLFVDGAAGAKHTQSVSSSALFRLPSGYKGNEFEIEVEGTTPINEICIYESAAEVLDG